MTNPAWLQHMSLMEGWLLGVILATIGYALNIRRFTILAVLAFLAGLLTAITGLDDITASTLTFSLAGLALVLSGAQALTRYLCENARRDAENLP